MRKTLSDKLCLPVYMLYYAVRGIAIVVQHIRGIQPRVGIASKGRLYLLPGGVFSAPHNISVSRIHRLNGDVFVLQPAAVFFYAGLAEAEIGLKLVVYLPCNYRIVICVVLCHDINNALGIAQKICVVDTPVTSDTCAGFMAVLFGLNSLGIFLVKPHRRAVRWGAQHDLDTTLRQHFDNVVQPAKIEAALLRLKFAPCKLRKTNHFNTGLLHKVCVRLPQ